MEIWNLVFMQYERSAGRAKEDFEILGDLPKKNIDTGLGLERVAMMLQGVQNMYEIDVMCRSSSGPPSSPVAGTAALTTMTSASAWSPTTSAPR